MLFDASMWALGIIANQKMEVDTGDKRAVTETANRLLFCIKKLHNSCCHQNRLAILQLNQKVYQSVKALVVFVIPLDY